MRIISGDHRGRHIHPPEGLPVRPTTDMAKEGLFNILNNYLDFAELDVLDLFCGTGNITYEFLSRGCRTITCVDSNPKCTAFVKRMLGLLEYSNAEVFTADVFRFLRQSRVARDLVFADPPYDLPGIALLPDLILGAGALKEGGWLVVEHPAGVSFRGHPRFFDHRTYSRVNFSFFVIQQEEKN